MIEFKCPCGATCRADEAKAGELLHCDACGLDLPVPASDAAPVAEVVGQPPAGVSAAGTLDAAQVADVLGQPPAGKAGVSPAAAEEFKARVADRTGFNEMMQQLHGVSAPFDKHTELRPARQRLKALGSRAGIEVGDAGVHEQGAGLQHGKQTLLQAVQDGPRVAAGRCFQRNIAGGTS